MRKCVKIALYQQIIDDINVFSFSKTTDQLGEGESKDGLG
jgi:hypothetical protein